MRSGPRKRKGRKRHRKKAAKKAAALEAKRLAAMTHGERMRGIVARFAFKPIGVRKLRRMNAMAREMAQSVRFASAMLRDLSVTAAMVTPRLARLSAQLSNLSNNDPR